MSGKWDQRVWIGLIWLIIGAGGGLCENGNEPFVYMKGGEFLTR
jgi:hypothetical protein